MKNIYNADLFEMLIRRIPEIKIIEEKGKLVLSHSYEDWDLITILAMRLGFVANRWMENQEPRTTVYHRY